MRKCKCEFDAKKHTLHSQVVDRHISHLPTVLKYGGHYCSIEGVQSTLGKLYELLTLPDDHYYHGSELALFPDFFQLRGKVGKPGNEASSEYHHSGLVHTFI